MKLAFIIIPLEVNKVPMTGLIAKTINAFFKEFDGCTHYRVQGVWKDHVFRKVSIECEKIEVAVPSDEHDVFIMMAKDVAVEAGVEEIMVQAPDGEILFIPGVK
mgnify:FL=1